ncbi:MAG: ROK family transcriptional regulator [Actinomycetota bacterium]|nr:ROK family transcriptional regulator [Actinomycetota bacterium]
MGRANAGASPIRADQASMRRTNTGLILRHLRDHSGQSRARVAAQTGLSKATMSSLISDLVERGLVTEGELDRGGSVGRPGLALHLDGGHVCGIGIEINVDYLSVTALDLRGRVLVEATRPLDTAALSSSAVVDLVADLIVDTTLGLAHRGVHPVSVTVAAPGSIDHAQGRVMFAPNLGWRDLHLVRELTERLGPSAPPVVLENDANLGAVAEHARVLATGVQDLVFLAGDVGVGAGLIVEGRLLRGASGFAGEVGHLPLDPSMSECACGRRGCWEAVVGLAAFLRLAADRGDPLLDPAHRLEDRMAEIRARALAQEPRSSAAVASIAQGLAVGVSLLADVFDPSMVVLGGYFALLGDLLVEPVTRTLRDRALSDSVPTVTASTLGLTSAARGGAHLALDLVFRDPGAVPPPPSPLEPAAQGSVPVPAPARQPA